eukprot:1115377-Prymnesium_polylepis.3
MYPLTHTEPPSSVWILCYTVRYLGQGRGKGRVIDPPPARIGLIRSVDQSSPVWINPAPGSISGSWIDPRWPGLARWAVD